MKTVEQIKAEQAARAAKRKLLNEITDEMVKRLTEEQKAYLVRYGTRVLLGDALVNRPTAVSSEAITAEFWLTLHSHMRPRAKP